MIELHIPGMLAVPARLLDEIALPAAPALRQWYRRAQVSPVVAGRYGFLASRLAVYRAPLAQLAWLGASGEAPTRQTFLATPVNLRAGMDDLVLFAGDSLEVTEEECRVIARDAAAHFGDEPGLRAAGTELLLQARESLRLETTPLHLAQGLRVRRNLPTGDDATRLHAWMNELQMFLHGHEINRVRAARGAPALNGLWLWGEGDDWSETSPPASRVVVHGDSLYMQGLGRLLGTSSSRAASPDALPEGLDHIVELDACRRALDADDVEAWQAAVEDIATHWLAPLLKRLDGDPALVAVLYGGDGRAYRVCREGRLRGLVRRLRSKAAPILEREA